MKFLRWFKRIWDNHWAEPYDEHWFYREQR